MRQPHVVVVVAVVAVALMFCCSCVAEESKKIGKSTPRQSQADEFERLVRSMNLPCNKLNIGYFEDTSLSGVGRHSDGNDKDNSSGGYFSDDRVRGLMATEDLSMGACGCLTTLDDCVCVCV